MVAQITRRAWVGLASERGLRARHGNEVGERVSVPRHYASTAVETDLV